MARAFANTASDILEIPGDPTILKFAENDLDFTIHGWVSLASTASDQTLIGKYPGTGNRGILLRTNNSGATCRLGVFWINSAGSGVEALTTTGFTIGQWVPFGATYDKAADVMRAYLRGATAGSASGNVHSSYTARWRVGLRANNVNPLNGSAGPVSMWSAKLSDDEMLALSKGVSPHRIRPHSLLAHWPIWGHQGNGLQELDTFNPVGPGPFTISGTTRVDQAPVGPLV